MYLLMAVSAADRSSRDIIANDAVNKRNVAEKVHTDTRLMVKAFIAARWSRSTAGVMWTGRRTS